MLIYFELWNISFTPIIFVEILVQKNWLNVVKYSSIPRFWVAKKNFSRDLQFWLTLAPLIRNLCFALDDGQWPI